MFTNETNQALEATLAAAGLDRFTLFLVDGQALILAAGAPLGPLSPAAQTAAIAAAWKRPAPVGSLPVEQAREWQKSAGWGNMLLPLHWQKGVAWTCGLLLAEGEGPPDLNSRALPACLAHWQQQSFHDHLRHEARAREALSGFLHHDLLQRTIYLRQQLAAGVLDEAAGLLRESEALIKAAADSQRPVLINQGIYFALQKLVGELKGAGLAIGWETDILPADHPALGPEAAAGLYYAAEHMARHAQVGSPGGKITLGLTSPEDSAARCRLSVTFPRPEMALFSRGMVLALEWAGVAGGRWGVERRGSARIAFFCEV